MNLSLRLDWASANPPSSCVKTCELNTCRTETDLCGERLQEYQFRLLSRSLEQSLPCLVETSNLVSTVAKRTPERKSTVRPLSYKQHRTDPPVVPLRLTSSSFEPQAIVKTFISIAGLHEAVETRSLFRPPPTWSVAEPGATEREEP